MDYHLFKKTVTGKRGKPVKTWYYWYYNQFERQVKKVCSNCATKTEAEYFIRQLPKLCYGSTKVSDIAHDMFIPGSEHCQRRQQFGKSVNIRTLLEVRTYIEHIINVFGQYEIAKLSVPKIQNYLIKQERSGSWKNRFQSIFLEIYDEATWQGIPIKRPIFTKFKRNSKRQSILSTTEIQDFLIEENFSSEMFYVFFLLTLSAGMRLGEIRAFRTCQFHEKEQAIIIDGFLLPNGERMPFNKAGSVENPKYRVTIIPDKTAAILKNWIAKNIFNPDDYIFQYNDRPVRQEYAENEFRRAIKKTGIDTETRKLSPHALRFTYVTRTRRLVDTSMTMLMAGHTSEAMTEHYTRFELDETVKQLSPIKDKVNSFFK